ncbi:MAG: RICIN domain-containing protein [Granulosicoccus sp.]
MLKISLDKITCIEETDEVGADEPYVLVTTVDYSSLITVAGLSVPIPNFEVVRYGPFSDVDKGETHRVSPDAPSFWGIANSPVALTDPDSVIFIVSVMENDDGDAEAKRSVVKGIIAGSVFGSLSLSRDEQATKLINDIDAALGIPTGAPSFDERIGRSQRLRFSVEELMLANFPFGVEKPLRFVGDGGVYDVTISARKSQPATNDVSTFAIRQASSGQFVDAHETDDNDFSVVTRTAQNNDTQKWKMTKIGGVFTIRQKSSGRFVDAHESTNNDFSLVTRNEQNNDTQRFAFINDSTLHNGVTILQLSNRRLVDAHETSNNDFSLVTRERQRNLTQLWLLTPSIDGSVLIQQASTRRYWDAHENTTNDFSLVTRLRQNNDTQLWLLNEIAAIYTIQQRSSNRFIDAHESSNNDFSAVTRTRQDDMTQSWMVNPISESTSTVQQLSNLRYLDAYQSSDHDHSVVTRTAQGNETQQWIISA